MGEETCPMVAKNLVLSVIGAGCVVATGAGSFYALRLNSDDQLSRHASTTPQEQALAAEAPAPRAAAPAPASVPVAMTEVEPVRAPARAAVSVTRPQAQPRRAAARPEQAPIDRSESDTTAAVPPATASASGAATMAGDPLVDGGTRPMPETAAAPAPTRPQFDEITIKEESVIGIQLETAISSETAKVEDRVIARVTRDLTVNGRTAIPSGAKLEGYVTAVERGGKFKERSRLGIRFTTLRLGETMRVPIQTETIFRDGDSPTGEATAKIGASAVVGTIIGAAIGGKKGAAIGTAAGAAGGTAAVLKSGRNHAAIAAGAPLTVRLTADVTFLIEKQSDKN